MEETKITKNQQQLKDSLKQNGLWRSIIYAVIVSLLTCMLIFCYIMVFSTNFYIKGFDGNYNVGVVDTSNHDSAYSGQLVSIREYNSSNDIRLGDEIYFSSVQEGSGVVTSLQDINKGYVTVSIKGKAESISASTIVGKVVSKTDFWGYVFWFFDSTLGIVVLNVLLASVVITHIVIVATTETSNKGKQLKAKLKKQNLIKISVNKMYNQNQTESMQTEKLLNGTYKQNSQEIINLAKSGNLSLAYLWLLTSAHDLYLPKLKLTKDDKIKITNCVELIFLSDEILEDQEYLIRDLLLKSELVEFDLVSFVESGKEFLKRSKNIDSLYALQTIIYVMLKTNNVGSEMFELIKAIDEKIDTLNAKNREKELKNLNNLLKSLIKF